MNPQIIYAILGISFSALGGMAVYVFYSVARSKQNDIEL